MARLAHAAINNIVEVYGGTKVFIPMFQHAERARREAIVLALSNGAKPERLARQHGISVARVLKIGLGIDRACQAETVSR